MQIQSTCELCGATYIRRRSDGRFCSRPCAIESYTRQRRANRPNVIPCTCAQCGTAFLGKYLNWDRATNRFCSPECRKRWGNDRQPRVGPVQLVCAFCGVEFLGPRKAPTDHRFCCPQHLRRFRDRHVSRSGRKGLGPSARVRYGNVCYLCGWDRGTCQAAHIVPHHRGGADHIDNVILLCPNCHWLFDHGGLTPEESARLPQQHLQRIHGGEVPRQISFLSAG